MVRPTGTKWWRLRYKFQGKERTISLGVYPRRLLIYSPRPPPGARRLLAEKTGCIPHLIFVSGELQRTYLDLRQSQDGGAS